MGVIGTLSATRQTIASSETVQSNTLAATERLQQQTIQTQTDLAAKQRQHEREEAREARIQERFESTYIDLLDYLGRCEQHVSLMTLRLRPLEAEVVPLDFPQDAWFRLNARLYAYATDHVRDGMLETQKALTEFAISYATLQGEKGQRSEVSSLAEARQDLESRRDTFLGLVTRVRADAIDDLRRLRSEPD